LDGEVTVAASVIRVDDGGIIGIRFRDVAVGRPLVRRILGEVSGAAMPTR